MQGHAMGQAICACSIERVKEMRCDRRNPLLDKENTNLGYREGLFGFHSTLQINATTTTTTNTKCVSYIDVDVIHNLFYYTIQYKK